MSPELEKQQVYLGYFATILLALVLAGALADFAVDAINPNSETSAAYASRLVAAIFFAICFANPAAWLIYRSPFRFVVVRAMLGFAFGIAIDRWLIDPYVGEGLARFILILIAACGLPIMFAGDFVKKVASRNGTSAAETLARGLLRVLALPDRLLFMLVMLVSFGGFSLYADTLEKTLLGLAFIISATTMLVAWRSGPKPQTRRAHEEWYDLIPEEEAEPAAHHQALDELAKALLAFLPSGAFFGGMTWAAGLLVPKVLPELFARLYDPAQRLEATFQVGLAGLLLVVAGAFVAVGIGMIMLRVIGHYGHWPSEQIRSSWSRMLRTMSFRPIRRDISH